MSEKSEIPPEVPTYFCWVRVVDIERMATRATVDEWKPPERPPGRLGIYHWNLPNRLITSKTAKTGQPVGVWTVAAGYFGRDAADTAFDYGPAFVDQPSAVDWLVNDPEGQRWDQEARNRFLIQLLLA